MSTLASAHAPDLDRSLESTPQPRRVIVLGPLHIDVDAHRVHANGHEVPLTWLEFKLLVTLAERPDRVQPRGQLLTEVWRVKPGNTTRTVDTHVKRLRDKLGLAGGMIQTVRGIGYRLSELPSIQDVDGRCSGRGAVGRTREDSHSIAAPAGQGRTLVGLPALGGRVVPAGVRWATRTATGAALPGDAARCEGGSAPELDRAAER